LFISAGDGVKFNLPMAAATTVLSWGLDQWKDAYIQAGQLELMYDSIKWPLDYFRWFSPGPPVSSTNKTDRYDITEIFVKIENTIKQTNLHLLIIL
jgi:hypothetical protein